MRGRRRLRQPGSAAALVAGPLQRAPRLPISKFRIVRQIALLGTCAVVTAALASGSSAGLPLPQTNLASRDNRDARGALGRHRDVIAAPELRPDVFSLSARKARQVATVLSLLDAYNRGSLDQVLALLDDGIGWSDCNYSSILVVNLTGKSEVATYLQQRFADHDRLEIGTIFNHNPEPETGGRALGIQYVRRTSDTLRALGFPNGISPDLASKVVFTDRDDRIVAFANGPFGGPRELCRPSG